MSVLGVITSLATVLGIALGYPFQNVSDIYQSRFDNCTLREETRMQCITTTSVCLARTDTIERIPFCLCVSGKTGLRCEHSVLPAFQPVGYSLQISLWVIPFVILIACAIGLYIYRNFFYNKVYKLPQHLQRVSVGV